MKRIRNAEEVRGLKPNQRLIKLSSGKVEYYYFLCVHPHNDKYVILVNSCEEPERFYHTNIIDNFATDYTEKDIISYRTEYHTRKLKELEQAMSELEK